MTSFAYESINDVIKAGFDILHENQGNAREEQHKIWFDYSSKTLERLSRSNWMDPSIEMNYLRLATKLIGNNMTPSQKISACLNYLIEVLPYVS